MKNDMPDFIDVFLSNSGKKRDKKTTPSNNGYNLGIQHMVFGG